VEKLVELAHLKEEDSVEVTPLHLPPLPENKNSIKCT
jgi:hypothetical protein